MLSSKSFTNFKISIFFIFCLFFSLNVLNAQCISTVYGTGVPGYSGDGGLAAEAQFSFTVAASFDDINSLYVATSTAIRRIDTITGIVTHVAGIEGTSGFSGDGGPATMAEFWNITDIVFDSNGDLIVTDPSNNRIRKIDIGTGIINTIVGNDGISTQGGDALTMAQVYDPRGLAFDSSGNLWFFASNSHTLMKLDIMTNIVTVELNSGLFLPQVAVFDDNDVLFFRSGFSGDIYSYNTITNTLSSPAFNVGGIINSLKFDLSGNLLFSVNNTIVSMDTMSEIQTIIAGNGTYGFSGDLGLPTNAEIASPRGLVCDISGNIFFANNFNNGTGDEVRIRRIGATCPSIAAEVPTIGQWGVVALSILLSIIGIVAIREKVYHSSYQN